VENATSTLVLVAHPGDETLGFSSVCREADIVSVTDGGRQGLTTAFQEACAALGGKQVLMLNLPAIDPFRLPIEILVGRIRELGSYGRVYTHSPLEAHAHHRDVAVAASRCFHEIWVRSCGGYAAEAHVLSRPAFAQKVAIINSNYAPEMRLTTDHEHFSSAAVAGVEAFVPTHFPEVIQALAHTMPGIRTDISDVWAFQTSPYEKERFDRTCAVLTPVAGACAPTSILEIGACEGAMTRRLRMLFPSARIRAVEANPVFLSRLRQSLGDDPNTDIVEASVLEVPLSADLVLLTEVLYLVPEHVTDILARVQAKYLLTAQNTNFDEPVSRLLHRFGWQTIVSLQVAPRFEPVDGRDSCFLVRRSGSQITLWTLAQVPLP
jgi:LmbE family N-acetylglucosaminyl deacetylase